LTSARSERTTVPSLTGDVSTASVPTIASVLMVMRAMAEFVSTSTSVQKVRLHEDSVSESITTFTFFLL